MSEEIPEQLREYFKTIGAKGGATSRRKLTPAQAREMGRKSAAVRRKKAKAKKKAKP